MTDDEWLNDLQKRLRKATERQAQLIAVGCCRQAWHLMTDPRHRTAVEAAERYADGLITRVEFDAALAPVVGLWANLPPYDSWDVSPFLTGATRHLGDRRGAVYAANYAARAVARAAGAAHRMAARAKELAAQQAITQDVLGGRGRILGPLTQTAVALADAIYSGRAFDRLPILADALEEAGCDNADILAHCRGDGPHVRGCWVVDLVLGKT